MRCFNKIVSVLFFALFSLGMGEEHTPTPLPSFPDYPVGIEPPSYEVDVENGENIETWILEKAGTLSVKASAEIIVPLEIISDVEVKAIVVDDQIVEIPFDVEMNKAPERKEYYRLKFSETEIDIDGDGKIDTVIVAPEFINEKVVKDSFVRVSGEGITDEGTYNRTVYMTIEVRE